MFFILQLVLHFTACSSYSSQIKPNNQELKPITRKQTQQPKNLNLDHQDINENKKKKLKFNTSEIIKPNAIRSTTNQDHRILHVLPQILTQSTPNSQQIKLINPVNEPTQIKPRSRNQSQQTKIKPRPTQSNPNPTSTDRHNQTTTTSPIKNISP